MTELDAQRHAVALTRIGTCPAFVGYADGFTLTCDLRPGHKGSHHDPARLLDWGPAVRNEFYGGDPDVQLA